MENEHIYKTELHCHSAEVSTCSNEPAENIVEKYVKYGYSTVVLTNHLNKSSFAHMEDATWAEKAEYFIEGYNKLKKAAGSDLNVLFGAEIRFPGSATDYLVYGITEDFLRNTPDCMTVNVGQFWQYCHREGYILIQAHPFRAGMMVTPVWQIDGIEVFNGHPGQSSFNDVAELYASHTEKFICTSGSDYHDDFHIPDGGILTAEPITNNARLVDVLARRDYSLIKDTDTMEAVLRSRG